MKLVEETVADGRWFPFRFRADQFEFAFIPPERHREASFLIYLQPPANEMRLIARSALSGAQFESTDLHFILHLGFGGSTLLGKILAEPGVAITFQEPPVVTDIVRYGSTGPQDQVTQALHEATRLLGRPIAKGESVICKMTHVGNGVAASMAAVHSTSQILCLQTPMEEMLLSFALRGFDGRMSARRIFLAIHESKMSAVPLTDSNLAELSDLQLGALAWLSMQKMMLDAASRLGPQRAGSITTADLMERTRETLRAIARHFRLDLDIDGRMSGGFLDRHSKTGEPFNAESRVERVAEGLRAHGTEIAPVVQWARKVAERSGIAWQLPYPLLG